MIKVYLVHSWCQGDDDSEYGERFKLFVHKTSALEYIKTNLNNEWYDDGYGGRARDVWNITLQEIN